MTSATSADSPCGQHKRISGRELYDCSTSRRHRLKRTTVHMRVFAILLIVTLHNDQIEICIERIVKTTWKNIQWIRVYISIVILTVEMIKHRYLTLWWIIICTIVVDYSFVSCRWWHCETLNESPFTERKTRIIHSFVKDVYPVVRWQSNICMLLEHLKKMAVNDDILLPESKRLAYRVTTVKPSTD